MNPTAEQLAIIDAVQNQTESLMIGAGAGTGKTTTLTLIASVITGSTLALAFNKKIADELTKRLPAHFVVKTLNGLGHRAFQDALQRRLIVEDKKVGRLMTEYSKAQDYNERLDSEEWLAAVQLVKKVRQLGMVPKAFPQHYRNSLIPDEYEVWEDVATQFDIVPSERVIIAARQVFTQSINCALRGEIDFDDQIYMSTLFMGVYPRFENVLGDEAQDMSALNHLQLKKLKARRYIVVGDRRQAIYAFRGADSQSMDSMRSLAPAWIDLPLNLTFRCPKKIVERQWDHAPDYRAHESNEEGEVFDWTKPRPLDGEDAEPVKSWEWSEVPTDGPIAVICRNNAPLLSMAYQLLSKRVGFQMLGRDFGKGLKRLLHKIAGTDRNTDAVLVASMIEEWRRHEVDLALAKDDESKADKISDQAESLQILLEQCKTLGCIEDEIDKIFKEKEGYSLVTLSSGHKSKGLEWHTVIHLDPWRIPSKWAKPNPQVIDGITTYSPAYQQEMNLKYVIETRAKYRLIFANMEDLQ